MPDSKITALTSISTSTDPANDPLVIVDVSDTSMAATGTTKKVTLNQLLGASGTATLASATITGDLTVDTSTLKVDSALNRVGVGTASPAFTLDVQATVAGAVYGSVANNDTGGSGSARFRVFNSGDVSDGFAIINNYGAAGQVNLLNYKASSLALWTNSVERFTISSTGVATWSNVGGVAGTAMTLNSTGLGVGTSPAEKLTVAGKIRSVSSTFGLSDVIAETTAGTGTGYARLIVKTADREWRIINDASTSGSPFIIYDATAAANRLLIDSSGNVGIGVTPSAWGTGFKALEFANSSFFVNALVAGNPNVAANFYYNTSAQPIYKSNGFASAYSQYNGAHSWATAPSGTAGNVITFNTAMTLDASGNLLVGTTSALSAVSGSSQIALGGAGLQTTSQAISAATATTICRSGSGGVAIVAGYNGTGQYSAIVLFKYGGTATSVIGSINDTGSTITYAISGANLQITSSLALTNLTVTCIRTA